ncbi:6444_t:CDS:2 [Ambispora gerdemannii]|uniref:6444_t:CDS:1 n=1 Tax=Ambispora gerdemannii TaxID=144530 RepID=A0A9N8Z8N1_9GLOM|nr:6444_t:CDS:2 [Ambispora gerdemannii]
MLESITPKLYGPTESVSENEINLPFPFNDAIRLIIFPSRRSALTTSSGVRYYFKDASDFKHSSNAKVIIKGLGASMFDKLHIEGLVGPSHEVLAVVPRAVQIAAL